MTLSELEKLAQEGMFDAYREEIGVEGLAVKALVRKLIAVARAARPVLEALRDAKLADPYIVDATSADPLETALAALES